MSRIWLLRGCAAAVLAVLVGAWALGVANGGDSSSPRKEADDPVPADTATTSGEPVVVVETDKPRRARESATTEAAVDETTPDAVPAVAGEAPAPEPTRTPSPKPRPSAQTPKPSQSPTPTPSQPGEECTDLVGVINCVLAPITTQP